jgi:hypothetical protein
MSWQSDGVGERAFAARDGTFGRDATSGFSESAANIAEYFV